MDQEAGFRLPTITALASQFRLPKALLAEVVGEFRSVYASVPPEFTDSYEKIPSDWVSLKYGQTLAKYVPKVAERPKAFNDAELTKVLAQMLRETFKQLAPTSTVLGCLLSTRAEQLIRNRRGDCAIYQDPSGRTVDYAARQAAVTSRWVVEFLDTVRDQLL